MEVFNEFEEMQNNATKVQKKYGLPYQGSKNFIAEAIVGMFPKCHTFVDVFAGGGAITHCAILHKKAKHYIMNDLNTEVVQLFKDALEGKYKDEKRWISREDFFASNEPFVRIVWSFNNCRTTYKYAREIEPFKRAFHYAVCFDDLRPFEEFGIKVPQCNIPMNRMLARRLFYARYIKQHHDEIKNQYIRWYKVNVLQMSAVEEDNIKEIEQATKALKDIENYCVETFQKSPLRLCDINKHLGNQMASHYFTHNQWLLPTPENYIKLKEIMPELDLDDRGQFNGAMNVLRKLHVLNCLQAATRLSNLRSQENLQSVERLTHFEIQPSSISIERVQRLEKRTNYQITEGRAFNDYTAEEIKAFTAHESDKVGEVGAIVKSHVIGDADIEYLSEDYEMVFQHVFRRGYEPDKKELKEKRKRLVWYCDPPYYGTSSIGYSKKNDGREIHFDYERFYRFCETLARYGEEVWISERWMPEDRFVPIIVMNKRNLFSAWGSKILEALYVPLLNYNKHGAEYYKRILKLLKEGTDFKCVSLSNRIEKDYSNKQSVLF